MLTAIAPDGSPYFRGRVPSAAPAAPPTGAAAGASPSRISFEVAPGKMQLRVAVEGSSAQVLDSEIREIAVPDLTAPQSVSTPEVFRARTVRDYQQIKADPDAIPAPGREFSRTERVLVRFAAYGAGAAPKAKLLNRGGQAISELTVAPGPGAAGSSQIELPLSGLAAGEYVVEISPGDADNVKELVAFRLTT
jgi:hypothetical protein